jgi:hypothetical protein
VYAAIGGVIARRDYAVDAPRAVVSGPVKLAHVAVAALRALLSAPGRLGRPSPRIPTRHMELADVPLG